MSVSDDNELIDALDHAMEDHDPKTRAWYLHQTSFDQGKTWVDVCLVDGNSIINTTKCDDGTMTIAGKLVGGMVRVKEVPAPPLCQDSDPTPADIEQGEAAVALLGEMVEKWEGGIISGNAFFYDTIIPRARTILCSEDEVINTYLDDHPPQPPPEPSADQEAHLLAIALKAVEKALQAPQMNINDNPARNAHEAKITEAAHLQAKIREARNPSDVDLLVRKGYEAEADRLRECLREVVDRLIIDGSNPHSQSNGTVIAKARDLLDGGGE